MSATIGNTPDFFCQLLGIPLNQVDFLSLHSSFPAERRPIQYLPIGRVSGDNIDYDKITAAVDSIIEHHEGESGLVHTANYNIARHVLTTSRHGDRLMGHESADRAARLNEFRLSPGRVMVSPSMGVGVDLPYDLCRFQIIVKIPFPNAGDPVRRAQAQTAFGKKLAIYDTAMALQQTYGRIMRAQDDWGVTYLLDQNWDWFQHSAKEFILPWFNEAIHRSDTFLSYQ